MIEGLPSCCVCDIPFIPDNPDGEVRVREMREQGWRIRAVRSSGPYRYGRWCSVCPNDAGDKDW